MCTPPSTPVANEGLIKFGIPEPNNFFHVNVVIFVASWGLFFLTQVIMVFLFSYRNFNPLKGEHRSAVEKWIPRIRLLASSGRPGFVT